MSKQRLLLLSGVSLVLVVFGVFVPTISLALTANIPQAVLAVGAVLFLLGGLGSLVAWVSGLIKTAARRQWGWFVTIVLFNVLGALLYAFRGSEYALRGSENAQLGYQTGRTE